MKTGNTPPGRQGRRATLAALLLIAAALVAIVGCTRPRLPKKPVAQNPIVSEHMAKLQRGAEGMARSLDEGNSGMVDDTAKYIANEFLQTRALPLAPRESGESINMTLYTQELDGSLQIIEELRRALFSNRWDVVSERYNDLRAACINCHATYVDRPIAITMPSARNF